MSQSNSTNPTYEAGLKAMVDDIVKGYLSFISSDHLREAVKTIVIKAYNDGLQEAEIKFNMNFTGDYNAVGALQNFGFNNIKDLTEEIKGDLRQSVSMGLMNRENISDLKARIQKVLKVAQERAELIAKTETVRAFNQGFYDAAKESKLRVVREWTAQPERNEDNPCPICEAIDGQRTGMNESFTSSTGDIFLPPLHPRCKCRVIYVQEDD